MTPSDDLDLDAIRASLQAERDSAREHVDEFARTPELGTAQGFGKRIGDGTTEAVSRLTDIGVGAAFEATLARVERALVKLDDGTYGLCDDCGQEIPAARLQAIPSGVLCIACATLDQQLGSPQRR